MTGPAAGGFHVDPELLWKVSAEVAAEQQDFHNQGQQFSSDLESGEGSAGRGQPGQSFAQGYDPIAEGVLKVWSASVQSIGGAAEGVTVTANNYVKADHTTNPHATGEPETRPVPPLVGPTDYPVPDSIAFGKGGGTNPDPVEIVQEVESVYDVVITQVVEHVMSVGRIATILPLGNPEKLRTLGGDWHLMGQHSQDAGQRLDGIVSTIDNPGNSAWHDAMQQFCRSIWGTTAWGHGDWRHGHGPGASTTSKPILGVLEETATDVSGRLEAMATAVEEVWREIKEILVQAAKETVKELFDSALADIETVLGGLTTIIALFISKIDTERLDKAIHAFESTAHDLGAAMMQLEPDLDRAFLSAPTFITEEVRAEGVGARSLTDFKDAHFYTFPGDQEHNHKYPIDLVNQEGIHGSHTLDKHVGFTDAQLIQRLHDQSVPAASSFTDLDEAQIDTQDAIDANQEEIDKWLSRPRSDQSIITLDMNMKRITGRSVSSADIAANPNSPAVHNAHNVRVVLKYMNGLNPPFVVLTSMPMLP